MSNVTGIGSDRIVDLKERVAQKQDAEKIKNGETGGPKLQDYYFYLHMQDEPIRAYGLLMINSSFAACGVPTSDGSGIDFSFASPLANIAYVSPAFNLATAVN